jgi:hypothetical protein
MVTRRLARGVLRLRPTRTCPSMMTGMSPRAIALSASPASESAFGLRFGARGSDNSEFYLYAISANGGHMLVYYRNGQWVNLYEWKRDGVVRQGYGALNRLAVEIRGTTILTGLNGQSVGSARAPAEVRGRVGFIVYQSGTEAVFNDLRVMKLPAS